MVSQEDVAGASRIHIKFKEAVEQLAAVSEGYQQEAVSFVRSFLNPDPVQRLTAAGALQHPFLRTEFPGITLDNMPPELKIEEYVPKDSEERASRDAMIKMIDDMLDREYAKPANVNA